MRLHETEQQRNYEIERARREVEALRRSLEPAQPKQRLGCIQGIAVIALGVLAVGLITAAAVLGEQNADKAAHNHVSEAAPPPIKPSPPHFKPRLLHSFAFTPTHYRFRYSVMRDYQAGINEAGLELAVSYTAVSARMAHGASSDQWAKSPPWRNALSKSLIAMRAAGNRLGHYPETPEAASEKAEAFVPVSTLTNQIADAIERSMESDTDEYWDAVKVKTRELTRAIGTAQAGLKDINEDK